MTHARWLAALALASTLVAGCDRVGRSVLGGGDPTVRTDASHTLDAGDDAFEPTGDDGLAEGGGNPMAMCPDGTYFVNGMCVANPVLVFKLTWDHPGNMDLHVVTPGGNEIAYFDTMEDDGWLTGDNTQMGPETIVWTIDPPPGNYVVCVVPFGITGQVAFTVTVTLRGVEVQRWQGTRDGAMAGGICWPMSPNLVGTYTVQ